LRQQAAAARGQAAGAPGPERHWTGKGRAHCSADVPLLQFCRCSLDIKFSLIICFNLDFLQMMNDFYN